MIFFLIFKQKIHKQINFLVILAIKHIHNLGIVKVSRLGCSFYHYINFNLKYLI